MLSTAPADYENPEVTTWLLTYAYFHRRDILINETELNETIPNELLQTLPSREHLLRLCWNLVISGLLRTQYNIPPLLLTITDEGIFQFRKYLQPLIEKSRSEGNLNATIDNVTGDKEVKNKIKDFFKKHSKLPQDEFNEKLKDLVWTLGKEAIIILVKIMLGVPPTPHI